MRAAIDILMQEHRFIEEVIGSLETFVNRITQGEPTSRTVITQYASFLRNYADRTHHGKEEDRLFVRMIEHGFPREYGPIGVMLADHVQGRGYTKALIEVGAARGDVSRPESNRVIENARGYISLLRSHIQKEDNILYPMALQSLPAPVLDSLEKEFFEFDTKAIGQDVINGYLQSGKDLIALFPPDPDQMAAARECVGCPGH